MSNSKVSSEDVVKLTKMLLELAPKKKKKRKKAANALLVTIATIAATKLVEYLLNKQ